MKADRKFSIQVFRSEGLTEIRFRGRITEASTEAMTEAFSDPVGLVRLDLEVERINSFGLGVLTKLLAASAQNHPIEFTRCSEMIVDSIQILGLSRYGRLISFFSRYLCDRCSKEDMRLLDIARDLVVSADGSEVRAPLYRCDCGGSLRVDEALDFVTEHPPVESSKPSDG
jgi:anti-anti-sigma regulatory factor